MSLAAALEQAAQAWAPADDTFDRLGYTPTPRQATFHAATEFDVLFGGAAGGGKSKALLMDGLRDCIRHPGIRVGAFRRTFGELRESLLTELAQVGYAAELGASWNGSEYELRFANTSLFMFRYAETIIDATRRQGGQYQKLLFDERTLTPPDVVAFLESRLRSGRRDIPVLGIRSSSNPGGTGHGAVKARYIDATGYGAKVVTDARGRTVRFIPAKLSDNPHLNPEYATDLQQLPEPMRRAFLDGSWDVFAGQVFVEWNRDRHVVPAFPIPEGWRLVDGVDYGYAAPWAVARLAVDGDGRVWVWGEEYGTGIGETDQAARILAAEAGLDVLRIADSAMWATTGEGETVADRYLAAGCAIVPADKGPGSRLSGKARVHSYLADAPSCLYHRDQGWESCPRLHVLDGAAPNLTRTLPDLPYDSRAGHEEDVDTRAEDHAYDALRYALTHLGGSLADAWAFPAGREVDPADLHPAMEAPDGLQPDDDVWKAVGVWH